MNINYLTYYAHYDNKQKRYFVPSATDKINYVIKALNHIGYNVKVISASATKDEKKCYHGGLYRINEQTTLKMFFTFPWGNKAQKCLSIISMYFFLLLELLKIRKGERILVYHSLGYMNILNFVHRIKKFHLVLEVEEIYADATGNKKQRDREVRFLCSADSYVFPTKLLSDEVNVNKKPEIIIHGTYNIEPRRECDLFRGDSENERTIHCVYAGILDPRKGGAAAAVDATQYLPNNYHIHILGFGTEEEKRNIKDRVAEIDRISQAKVSYDGVLSGEKYIRFIQSCDIGLSTQNPTAAFNGTSFPSKILSYMANGLRVVSIRIPVVETSAIADLINYYDNQTPMEIAKAIMSVRIDEDYDSRIKISQLALEFERDFGNFLSI